MTFGDVRKLNTLVRRARQWADAKIHIPSVPTERWALIGMSDAALANGPRGSSQAGQLVLLMDRDVLEDHPSRWGPLLWRSHEIRRIVGSSMTAETASTLDCLGQLEFAAVTACEIIYPDFLLSEKDYFALYAPTTIPTATQAFEEDWSPGLRGR